MKLSGGSNISSSAQIGDGVIVDADVNASAAIAGSKLQALSVGANAGVIPSTGIADAHVAATAAIAGSKLQALSVGANAGVIPSTGIADAHVATGAAIAASKLLGDDTAYGVGWNASLRPVSQNAIYDKIETLSTPTCVSIIPLPDGGGVGDETTFAKSANTEAELTRVVIPFKITVNKITIRTTAVSVAGTLDLTLYSEDGQTQLFSVTTATINGGELVTTAVGAVVLNPGIYYLMFNTNGTADVTLAAFQLITGAAAFSTTLGILGDVASEPDYRGQLAISAGTPPATFDPTALSDQNHKSIIFRLDN